MTTANSRLPSQIKYIIGQEGAERFSFYGMRGILTVFMIQYLLFKESDATAVYHFFVSACYWMPLFGGYLSDRYWGKYKTIMRLSLFYCLGHGVLAVWENPTGLYIGLGLIALGSGGIKPCVSSHVGDQFTTETKHLLQKVYNIFYFTVNLGSTFSSLAIPWTLTHYGPRIAFGIPGILMALATFIFWLGRDQYVVVPPTGKGGSGFISVFWYALKNWGRKIKGQSFLEVAKEKFSTQVVEDSKAVLSIMVVYLSVTVFWALFDQHGSSWIVQATKMDLSLPGGGSLNASMLQSMNPIMVMILIPLFSFVLFPALERRGYKITMLGKMTAGMFVAAFSFVGIAILQMFIDNSISVHALWQTIPYIILTSAEILISITGLEFSYTQAPRSMKSTIMSFWYLTVSMGNLIAALVAKVNVFEGSSFFWFFAILMMIMSFVFWRAASRYKMREYIATA